ncbi:MAG: BrnT family toxin [Candidatus Omnitrophota bacterium]|jgi:uncharacterized DUF497 family protein|nr:BrnT family toxin [Candidatus Omnitrophota bacterium]
MIQERSASFIWDPWKEIGNIQKHGVDFTTAAKAFMDPQRKIFTDSKHSHDEPRYFCLGKVDDRVLTVRFLYRHGKIRILGAGYWRKGDRLYASEEI